MLRRGVSGTAALAAVALAGSLSGCSAAAPEAEPAAEQKPTPTASAAPYTGSPEMTERWQAATDAFAEPLPDGYVWPENHFVFNDASAGYEEGVENSLASFYWLCAWEAEFLKLHDAGDDAAASDALDRISDFPRAVGDGAVGMEAWIAAIVDPARDGVTNPLQAEVKRCETLLERG